MKQPLHCFVCVSLVHPEFSGFCAKALFTINFSNSSQKGRYKRKYVAAYHPPGCVYICQFQGPNCCHNIKPSFIIKKLSPRLIIITHIASPLPQKQHKNQTPEKNILILLVFRHIQQMIPRSYLCLSDPGIQPISA